MNNHENISDELLARYLAETATGEEVNRVKKWLAESETNEQEFAAYKVIWQHSSFIHNKRVTIDTNAAWNKVRAKMANPVSEPSPYTEINKIRPFLTTQKPIQRKLPLTLWAAAVVALLITAYGFYFFRTASNVSESVHIATSNNTSERILPDGTKIFLNYNSSITYPETFEGDFRTVSLRGEAFFNVKPDTLHPFIINANGTEITVLGTSFNVKAYSQAPVRVDVSTGKVLVQKEGNEIYLTKGESAEVLPDTIRSVIQDINILGYRTQIFDFNAANLHEVVSSIRNGYHIDLRLSSDKISQCRLTIRFEKEPMDATLSVIAETLDLKLRKEGKTYWLDGNGCQ